MIANVQHWTELIAKKLSGNIREEEAKMLDAWIARDPEHAEYYAHLAEVWSVTDAARSLEAPPQADWADLTERIGEQGRIVRMPKVKRPAISRKAVLRVVAAAAVLLLGIVVVTLLTREPVIEPVVAEVIETPMQEVTLPDGTKVLLRKGSRLEWMPDFDERHVTLFGEAFFDVTHDETHPFIVSAGEGTIRVLGTRFNVIAKDQTVELYVEEGQVAFAPAESKYEAKIFSEGQAGMITTTGTGDVERIAPPGPNITSWHTGKLVFDHVPLDQVIRDLSRHYGIGISVADSALYACELKTDFTHATIADVIETLRFSLNLEIEKTDSTLLISGEPCVVPPEVE